MAILNSKSGASYDTETGKKTTSTGVVSYQDPKAGNDTAISSTDLQPQGNTNLPPAPVYDNSNVQSGINNFTAKNTVDSEAEAIRLKAQKDAEGVSQLYKDIGVISGQQGQFMEEAGGYEAKKQYDEYTSQMEAEQLRLRRESDKLRANNPTGALASGLQNQLDDMERKSLSKQADIAILGNAAGRRYDTALSIAKDKVEMLMAPKKAELDGLKYIQENNKAFQTAEFSNLLARKNTELANEQKKLDTIESIKIEAVKNGLKNTEAFANIKTIDDALKVAGGYLVSPKEKLELQKLQGDIDKNNLELIAAKSTLGGTTGDPVLDIVSASAKYGDKRLTDSQLEKIQKAQQALGSMETLQGLLSQGTDGLKTTGPLSGRVRTLVSQMGGDADARAINATIQGLIPTVARGIFGEVGVLTDTDIENYRKTVPNLNSTEAQNKLVSIIMYDVLTRSLESTLTTNAANQTNVSGFAPTYKDIKARVNTLKTNLGVAETSPIDPLNQSKMDIGWDKTFSNVTDSLNSFLK
jgi:hypothetical protein